MARFQLQSKYIYRVAFLLGLLLFLGCDKELPPEQEAEPPHHVIKSTTGELAWAPFEMDPEKGIGKVLAASGYLPGSFRGAVRQLDGKLISVGTAQTANARFSISRLSSNGTLDTSFLTTGRTTTSILDFDIAQAALYQTDGKLISVGYVKFSSSNFGVARYNSNGSLDTAFSTLGTLETNISGTDKAYAALLQSDGKPIAVGTVSVNNNIGVVRYNTNGSLDTTFNTTGKVNANFSGVDVAYAATLQTDGLIVVGGGTNNGAAFTVARFLTDGQYDTAFNTTGLLVSGLSGSEVVYALLFQPDGKIVAVGSTSNNADFGIYRCNSNGTLDTSFNTTGGTVTNLSGTDFAYTALLETDGRLLAGGGASNATHFGLARYTTNGVLDTAFNTTGKVMSNFGLGDLPYALVLETNGRYLAVGTVDDESGQARYNTNGTLDTAFNTGGSLISRFTPGMSYSYAMSVSTSSSTFVVGSSVATGSVNDFSIMKFTINGQLDASFGTGGKVISDLSGEDVAYATLLQTDGRLVGVGTTSDNTDFGLARYHTNGTLDTTFNTTGKIISDLSGAADVGYATGLQTDGKILAFGSTGDDTNIGLARYQTNGTLDTTFNTGGVILPDISGTDRAYALSIQVDGKILAAGITADDFDCLLLRYNTNGSLDTTFNTTGILITDFNGGYDFTFAMSLLGDGGIVTAGPSDDDFGLARFTSNGSLDTSFHTSGFVVTDISGNDFAQAVSVLPGGKILAAGHSANTLTTARYLSDGTLDTAFHTTGTYLISTGEGQSTAYSVGLLPDGHYLVGGWAMQNQISQFLLVKLAP